MSDTRERVAIAMFDVGRDDDELTWEESLDRRHIGPVYFRNYAAAAISTYNEHLWSMADDPAVIEAMGQRLAQGTLFPSEYHADEDCRNRTKELASAVFASGLVALIGPRPSDRRGLQSAMTEGGET